MLSKAQLAKRLGILPGQQTVTLTRPMDSSISYSIAGAVKKPLTYKQLAFGAELGLENVECTFIVPYDQLSGGTIKNGDKIVDADSLAWTVLHVEVALLGSTYRVFVQKQK